MQMAAERSVGVWGLNLVLFSLFCFLGYYLVAQNIVCREKVCVNQRDFHVVLTLRSYMSSRMSKADGRNTQYGRPDHVLSLQGVLFFTPFFSESVEEVRKRKSTEMPAELPFWKLFSLLFPGVECQGQLFSIFEKRQDLPSCASSSFSCLWAPLLSLAFLWGSGFSDWSLLSLCERWFPCSASSTNWTPFSATFQKFLYFWPTDSILSYFLIWILSFDIFSDSFFNKVLVWREGKFCALSLHLKLEILSTTFWPFDVGWGFS